MEPNFWSEGILSIASIIIEYLFIMYILIFNIGYITSLTWYIPQQK